MNKLYSKPMWALILLIVISSAIYLINAYIIGTPPVFKAYVRHAQYLTGVWAWVIASVLVILAQRPSYVEKFGPLDQAYRLHRIFGIACVIISLIHYFAKELSIPLLNTFISIDPQYAGTKLESTIFGPYKGFAKDLALYICIISIGIVLITLITKISYRVFFHLHRFFAIFYLMLIFHAVVLVENFQIINPVYFLTIIISLYGGYSSILLLFGKHGIKQSYKANITTINHTENYCELTLKINKDDLRNKYKFTPGSFAYLKFDHHHKHPFSIASFNEDGDYIYLGFLIKKVGKFTEQIANLNTGKQIYIEGSYGSLNPYLPKKDENNLFVFCGVGYAPFAHYLNNNELKNMQGKLTVLALIQNPHDEIAKKIQELKSADLNLDLNIIEHYTQGGQRYTQEQINDLLSFNQFDHVYFCGFRSLASTLKNSFIKHGGNKDNFHMEDFNFRAL